jgi:thymidine kinase
MMNMAIILEDTIVQHATGGYNKSKLIWNMSSFEHSASHDMLREPLKELILLVSVEGNIGTGKTTFLENLESFIRQECKFFGDYPPTIQYEPVHEWITAEHSNGKSILELFYEDRKKYSFEFQNIVLDSIMSNLEKEDDLYSKPILITERSVLSSFYIFTKTLFEHGDMNQHDYDHLHVRLNNHVPMKFKPSFVIYLRSDPNTCFQRIQQRKRVGEKNISLNYVMSIHEQHEVWIQSFDTEDPVRRPLILDTTDESPENMARNMKLATDHISSVIFEIFAKTPAV